MKRVVIESPYAGNIERNEAYARAALLHSLKLGEAPLASHLLYTQVLDDTDPEERKLGMEAGWAWTLVANAVVVYIDLGISDGMQLGIDAAKSAGVRIEMRTIPGWAV